LIFWSAALISGYALTRNTNPLAVILPFGIITLVIHNFDDFGPGHGWALPIVLFLSLILLGRLVFFQYLADWKVRRIFAAPDVVSDIQILLWLAAGGIVLFAWLLPASFNNVESATLAWEKIYIPIRDRIAPAVSALESPYGSGNRDVFYGESLALGRTAALGEMPIFTLKINSSVVNPPPRYYWRGRAYDTYSNGEWRNLQVLTHPFQPDLDLLRLPESGTRLKIRANVTVELSRQALIYSPGDLYWVNRPGSVFSSPGPDRTEDLAAWLAEPILLAGDRYELQAQIINPTVEQLRSAGTDYPNWIKERYLQVPVDIAEPIHELAFVISAQQPRSPYDQAVAITAYLREEIEYSTELPPLPDDKDPLMWILFEKKEGFCMYTASAEVLLLRSLGIPARLAVGFTQGELERGNYHVKRVNSHAWPEVYFPNIGWVEFEPTSIQAPLVRPPSSNESNRSLSEGDIPALPNANQNFKGQGETRAEDTFTPTSNPAGSFLATRLGRFFFITLLTLLIVGSLSLGVHFKILNQLPIYLEDLFTRYGSHPPIWLARWIRWNEQTSIERSFQIINLSLGWFGSSLPFHATPAQRARHLVEDLPAAQKDIEALAHEHQVELFTPRAGDPVRARKAALAILLESVKARLRRIKFF
jgi:transglutaminase-like putative cysteine protease